MTCPLCGGACENDVEPCSTCAGELKDVNTPLGVQAEHGSKRSPSKRRLARPSAAKPAEAVKRRVSLCSRCRAGKLCEFAGTKLACKAKDVARHAKGGWSFTAEANPLETTNEPYDPDDGEPWT